MPNLLSGETSPYLLQHAAHPVAWQPWGPAALAEARSQGKPILLSIGYAACHWCHVMAHESFEDEATAALMNAHFVNIKVDREERPDLDQLYQDAHQLLTQKGGGWPLTVFLAPDGTPFHSGTYYPPEARYGRPAFKDLLGSVAEAWASRRPDIERQNTQVRAALQSALPALSLPAQGPAAALAALAGPVQDAARQWLAERHDAEHGGFGGAPKFPHPSDLAWLLERGVAEGDGGAREMALHSLASMARGGLQDQLAGGFFRYSVDAHWGIPHFEKMLSDNGLLLTLYADAAALTGEPVFGRAVEATVAWLLTEMQLPGGGFASSLDADSDPPGSEPTEREGAFYVWQAEAVRAALKPVEWDLASAHWNLIDAPNFEGRAWHLIEARPAAEMARTLQQPQTAIQTVIDAARAKLLALREARPRPARDDKLLTGWNALAIKGLVRAAQVAGRPDWVLAARRALQALHTALWVPESGAPGGHRLLATGLDGRGTPLAPLNAYLDDHAFLLDALLSLLQSDFRESELQWATQLAEALLGAFEDPAEGGFFFTRHDHEALIVRSLSGTDHALPSGNAVAALSLLRLGQLLGEPRYQQAAERTLLRFAAQAAQQPGAWSGLLRAALEQQHAPTLIVLRGTEAPAWRDALLTHCLPHTLVIALPEPEDGEASTLPEALDKPLPPPGQTQAWLCSAGECSPPVGSLAEVKEAVGLGGRSPTLH